MKGKKIPFIEMPGKKKKCVSATTDFFFLNLSKRKYIVLLSNDIGYCTAQLYLS